MQLNKRDLVFAIATLLVLVLASVVACYLGAIG
jgi:hypothetical protein